MIHPPRWLRRMPVVKQPLRRLAKRHAPVGPIDLDVEGIAWRLAPRDNKVDFDIWYKRRLEEATERAFLARHLGRGDVFVDVGANVGLYPVWLLARVPGLTAITFEPLDRLRARQVENLQRNGLADRADVRAEAIGPHGAMTLFESANAGASSVLAFDAAKARTTVRAVPLADALAGTRVAALKIDVEGFEADVLVPYLTATEPANLPRAVVVETLHRARWPRDCLSILSKLDYLSVGHTAENALLLRTER